MQGFLKTVTDIKKEEIARSRASVPLKEIRRQAENTRPSADFAGAMAAGSLENPGIISYSPTTRSMKPNGLAHPPCS